MRRLPAFATVLVVAVLVSACQWQSAQPPLAPAATVATEQSTTGPTTQQAGFVTGLNVPWAVGGKRIERDGTTRHDTGEWPDFPVSAIRLWDTRTAWLHLEPADDQWDFATLDAHLAKAEQEGVDDVTLVLAGTPRWAAVRETPDDAPWLGPGSASPPADLEQWREYVRTVASRYAGRIDHYEIGNEPNLLTFWNGTADEFADLVRIAAGEIDAADPAATVIVNAGLVRRPADIKALDAWIGPVAGSDLIDVISVHVYPTTDRLAQLPELLAGARAALAASGFAEVPAWVTEVNVQDGSMMTDAGQESVIGSITAQIEDAGFVRAYWYAWTDLGPLNLIQLAPGTAGARALGGRSG